MLTTSGCLTRLCLLSSLLLTGVGSIKAEEIAEKAMNESRFPASGPAGRRLHSTPFSKLDPSGAVRFAYSPSRGQRVASGSNAQTPESVVPVQLDPMHRPVYQDDNLWVLDIQIPPEATTLYHVHDAAVFYVFVSASVVDVQELGGEWLSEVASVQSTLGPGEIYADIEAAQTPVTHRVKNVGGEQFSLMAVVSRREQPAADVAEHSGRIPGRMETENLWFHQTRAVIQPSASLNVPAVHFPLVLIQASAGDAELWADATQLKDLSALGDFAVIAVGQEIKLVNRGGEAVTMVLIELH